MLYATDTVALGDVRVSDSGYLEAFARTVRTGVQQYLGAELKRPDLGVVNVYRDEAEVFAESTLRSFDRVPVTLGHPPGGVNAQNWRQVSRGTSGTRVLRDGEFMRIDVKIKDATAVTDVRDGICQLSAGYRCKLVWEDGIAPDGTPYQAKQTEIVADHIAIVPAGRAGPECRIGDSAWPTDGARGPDQQGEPRDPTQHRDAAPMTLKTHTIGDHAVEMSDAAIVAVKGLQKELATALADALTKDAALTGAKAEHAEAIRAKDAAHAEVLKAKDTELATKDAEIDKLKANQVDDAKLDALATARADVIGKAKAIVADVKTDGVSVASIRRSVVATKLGDAAVKDKSDDYVEARFDGMAADAAAKPDAFRRAVIAQPQLTADADPHAKRREEMANAWKGAA